MKILQEFIKKIKKLKNYYVLCEDDQSLLLGTHVCIKRQIESDANVFMPYNAIVTIKPHVILVLSLSEDKKGLDKYKDLSIPIYTFPKHILSLKGLTEDEIEVYIDKFVETNILK
jgi:hypothetical protein